ncbi:MAG TPA: NUDIX hydrolase [Myxococcaceae bacterium]|nr:NUDIX hydrolase [Myxococcaceae bacterium]
MKALPREVVDIEIVEDFSATARCDEGFLQLRRLRCRNRRADGSSSSIYRVDVIDRPRLDAIAVLIYRRGESGLEILTRQNLRPAAYFRTGKPMAVPDGRSHLKVEEIVAGLLEPSDQGDEGLKRRAAEEVREEAGIEVKPEDVRLLGAPFFVVPGILSEKIFPAAVDVTGLALGAPKGDGSPLEEGGALRWRKVAEALAACRSGEIQDAKTELAICRLLAEHAASR